MIVPHFEGFLCKTYVLTYVHVFLTENPSFDARSFTVIRDRAVVGATGEFNASLMSELFFGVVRNPLNKGRTLQLRAWPGPVID